MNKKTTKIIFLGLMVFLMSYAGVSAAELGQNTVNIKASPKTPRPGQIIYVELVSAPAVVDLKRSEITWTVNNNIVKKGIGKDRITIKAGEVGSKYKINALVRTFRGDFVTKTISIFSEEVTIMWEANTYTPPFYKGKALDTAGSRIKLVAFPNIIDGYGKRIPTKDLIYEWSVDGTFIKALSGIGENVYTIRSETVPITVTVKLKVSSFNKKIEAITFTDLKISNPKIIIYENSPLLGMLFNRSLENKTEMDENEISVVPYPFFFSINSRFSELLSYNWFVGNDVIISPDKSGGSITFASSEKSGLSQISLLLKNIMNKYQKAKKNISIKF